MSQAARCECRADRQRQTPQWRGSEQEAQAEDADQDLEQREASQFFLLPVAYRHKSDWQAGRSEQQEDDPDRLPRTRESGRGLRTGAGQRRQGQACDCTGTLSEGAHGQHRPGRYPYCPGLSVPGQCPGGQRADTRKPGHGRRCPVCAAEGPGTGRTTARLACAPMSWSTGRLTLGSCQRQVPWLALPM